MDSRPDTSSMIAGMCKKALRGCTSCERRQPRRNPSRLRNRMVVLTKWNWIEASCRGHNISWHEGTLDEKCVMQNKVYAQAQHPIRLNGQEARSQQAEGKGDKPC